MTEFLLPGLMLIGTTLLLLVLGMALNRGRVQRWRDRADSAGQATCRDCGHQGQLSYGILAGKILTSANIRLICEKCQSENWFVPGGKRDTGTRNREKQSA